jgi:hypothetical protein
VRASSFSPRSRRICLCKNVPIITAVENWTPRFVGRVIVLMFFALVFILLAVGSNSGSAPSTHPSKGEVREACTQLNYAIQAQQSGNVAGAQEEFAWALMHAQASPDRALYADIDREVEAEGVTPIRTTGGKKSDNQQGFAPARTAISECRNQGAWPSR